MAVRPCGPFGVHGAREGMNMCETITTDDYEVFYQADQATLAEWFEGNPDTDKQAPCMWGNGKPGWYQWQLDGKGRPCEPYGPFETKDAAIASAEAGDAAP